MNLSEYYNNCFRGDVGAVLAWYAPHLDDEPFFQRRSLSSESPVIKSMKRERIRFFAISLYLTVLVDQVMYSRFKSSYQQFRALTQYPKWKGDCPGACNYHMPAESIFQVIGLALFSENLKYQAEFLPLLAEAVPFMREEVVSFFRLHMPEVDGDAVWDRCMLESPLSLLRS